MAGLDHFGVIAPLYDRLIPLRKPERLVKLLGLPVPGPLLDVGGGTGRVAQSLRGLASQIIVADLSMDMLRQAAGKEGLRQICSPSERLPFSDRSFERIIMVDALHHVYSHQKTASELWRVLKPGGKIVILEPDVRTAVVKMVALLEKLALMRSHFLSPPLIAGLFSQPKAKIEILKDGFNAWVIVDRIVDH
jgi:demethylmenaquinone methyltransferase/2-methoxy-6-polyprenyl-1,4-benzoquinol methylase